MNQRGSTTVFRRSKEVTQFLQRLYFVQFVWRYRAVPQPTLDHDNSVTTGHHHSRWIVSARAKRHSDPAILLPSPGERPELWTILRSVVMKKHQLNHRLMRTMVSDQCIENQKN